MFAMFAMFLPHSVENQGRTLLSRQRSEDASRKVKGQVL
jgi:hypothetical protein